MHTDRRRRPENSKERRWVVDLIKINTFWQESIHRERQEQKHWGAALMGSIDWASVWGQLPCPWWPISHWLDDSHQESFVHAYLPPSLNHSLTHSHPLFPPYYSAPSSAHLLFCDHFLHSVSLIHLDFPFSLIHPPLSSCCPSPVPLTHLISLSMLFFPLSSSAIPGGEKKQLWLTILHQTA